MKNFILTVVALYEEIHKIKDKYIVHLFPSTNEDGTISCVETMTTEYPDLETIKLEYNIFLEELNKRILNRAKLAKIKELDKYDKSTSVNSFIVNGNNVWIERDKRTSINYSTLILKKSGQEITDLWIDDICYSVGCDTIIELLSLIEIYAKKCYSVTARHRSNILKIDNLDDLESYDFTQGYPDKLNFTI